MTRAKSEKKFDRDQLIEQYRPYVKNIVNKIIKSLGREVDIDDLIGYGELGLIEAAERFEPKFKVNFMTFAYYRIRGAVFDGLRSMGWVSRSLYSKIRYEERANLFLSSVNDRYRSSQGQFSLRDEIDQIGEVITGLSSIYITSIDSNEQLQLSSNHKSTDPYKQAELQQARELLRTALQKLPEQERLLIEYYYYHDMTIEQAGKKLGLSKSWASRLHARAIQKLQKILSELEENPSKKREKKNYPPRKVAQL